MSGPPWRNIVAHRTSALPTFVAIELTGVLALVGLIRMIRGKAFARWNALVVLVLAIASLALAAPDNACRQADLRSRDVICDPYNNAAPKL